MRQETGPVERASMMIEAVLAVGIVSIGALSIIGMLGQSNTFSSENRNREEAIENLGFVKSKLQEIPFEEAYEMLKGQTAPYYSYQYSANPESLRSDGSAEPERGEGSRLRRGFRRGDDPLLKKDLEFREGGVFRIRISQLLANGAAPAPLPPPDKLLSPGFSMALEFFIDPLPGENEGEWVEVNRVLRVPVSITR
ncbi:MAG: hypothetical protein P1U86_06960 [Verrucomicrobiales bacterium]|nr:hypothetical protein [Verrucomicrobiales bacterium]